MAAKVLSLVVTVLFALEVRGDCEPGVIKKIEGLWGSSRPYDILPSLVGNQSYLYLPTFYDKETLDGLKCLYTELCPDKATTNDYFIYTDPKRNTHTCYDMVEEEEGIITNISGDQEDQMYVAYFKHGVMGVYQCGQGYEAFITLTVVDYDPKNKLQTAAIAEGTLKLLSLGKVFGTKVNMLECCDN